MDAYLLQQSCNVDVLKSLKIVLIMSSDPSASGAFVMVLEYFLLTQHGFTSEALIPRTPASYFLLLYKLFHASSTVIFQKGY